MKKFLRKLFKEDDSRASRFTNDFFALLTIVSIVSLVLETVPSLVQYSTVFTFIEWTAVSFFGFEYISRTVISKPTLKYTFSFFGAVDLISILPTLLGLGNFTFLKSVRALRIIRLLRMLRLAKVTRGRSVTDENFSVLSFNILIYFTTLLFALLVTGTAMYLVESNLSDFSSIPAGMWWSFKVFIGSISVLQPETTLGEVFYVLTRFTGLLLLGLLIGVVGNVFRTLLMGK